MKKLKWLIFGLLIGAALFIGGLYVGNLAPESETGFSVEDIAVVNLDESIEYLNEVRNFGAELMTGMDPRYQLTGLSDARNGLQTGRFAAYIIIPANFSHHVISINTALPMESIFNFEISSYLEEDSRLLAFYHVLEFQRSYRERLSSMYLASILNTFHRGQDSAQVVLENDESDLAALLAFNTADLMTRVELTDITRLEQELPTLDTSEYTLGANQALEDFIQTNQGFMLLAQTELEQLLLAYGNANEAFWLSTHAELPIPFLEEIEALVVLIDISEYLDGINDLNSGMVGIDAEHLAETVEKIGDVLTALNDKQSSLADIGGIRDELEDIQQQLEQHLDELEDIHADVKNTITDIEIILIDMEEVFQEISDLENDIKFMVIEIEGLINQLQLENIQHTNQVFYYYSKIQQIILTTARNSPHMTFTDIIQTLEWWSPQLINNIYELFALLNHPHPPTVAEFLNVNATFNFSDLSLEDICEQLDELQQLSKQVNEAFTKLTEELAVVEVSVADITTSLKLVVEKLDEQTSGIEDTTTTLQEQAEVLEELALKLERLQTMYDETVIMVDEIEIISTDIHYISDDDLIQSIQEQVQDQLYPHIEAIETNLANLVTEQETFINDFISTNQSGQTVLAGYVQTILAYDLTSAIDEQQLHAHINNFFTQSQEISERVNNSHSEIIEFAHSSYEHTTSQLFTMRDEVYDANNQINTAINEGIDDLRYSRGVRNEENQELLLGLTNTLLHTRVGSLVNHDLVNILTRPVDIIGNYGSRIILTESTEVGWMIPSIIGLLTTATIVFLLNTMISKEKEEAEG